MRNGVMSVVFVLYLTCVNTPLLFGDMRTHSVVGSYLEPVILLRRGLGRLSKEQDDYCVLVVAYELVLLPCMYQEHSKVILPKEGAAFGLRHIRAKKKERSSKGDHQ
jgi:hypothetical protein